MQRNHFSYLIILAGMILSCSPMNKAMKAKKHPANPVVAHRGAFKKNGFPENSIAGLREAIRLGCSGSEFDVWMTADDSLIVNHDPHYHGLTIEKTGFDNLRQFPLANGEPLPTLREYLLAGLQNNPGTTLVVEVKPTSLGKARGQYIMEKVLALVRELKAEKNVLYIAFNYDMLLHLRSLDKFAHLQYLNGDKSPTELKEAGIDGLDYHYSVFQKKPEWIEEARKNKMTLNAWTVNDPAVMEWLLEKGFEYITTNEPEILKEIGNK